MRFLTPEYLLLLGGLLLLTLFLVWSLRRKKQLLQRFGDIPLIMKTAPFISFARQGTKIALLVIGLAFVVLALARLQFGTHMEKVKRQGIDLLIGLDVSNSMLAADMRPNRLEVAKQEIRGSIERLKGDRIGLMAFAGEAFIQCPLTLDYTAAEMLLGAMDNESVGLQGTSLSTAIEKGMGAFNQQEQQHKVLLLLTDGEDQEGGAIEAAEQARQQGIRIYTVGIGSPAGVPIPILDRRGQQVGFKKDDNGEVIVSRLDEVTLQKIALTTGGKYYRASGSEMELDKIFAEIEGLEKKEQEGTMVTRFDDRFQWPLAVGLLFLVFEFFLPERRRPRPEVVHA